MIAALFLVISLLGETALDASVSDLSVGQIQLPGASGDRPNALRRLLWETAQRTSVQVSLDVVPVTLADDALFVRPLLYWMGAGHTAALPNSAVHRLRRHLTYGGTLIIDHTGEEGDGFDRSVRTLARALFPDAQFERVSRDHVLYKSFFLVDQEAGRVLRRPYLEAIRVGDRLAIIYSQNDMAGAWARDDFGQWMYDVEPGGEHQREMSYRFGINLFMYALCLDYKSDLVHVPFLLKRVR
jgi:hypothetical protein